MDFKKAVVLFYCILRWLGQCIYTHYFPTLLYINIGGKKKKAPSFFITLNDKFLLATEGKSEAQGQTNYM